MEAKDTSTKEKEKEYSKLIIPENMFKNLKSDYFIRKIFDYIHKKKSLETIRYNKNIQKRINININHYKEYSEKYSSIEIEIKPKEKEYGRFINIKEEDEKYYHIYYNDNNREIKRENKNIITKKIKKIKSL